MAKTFRIWQKKINLQILKADKTPNRINSKKSTLRLLATTLKGKENNLETVKEKLHFNYR